MEDRLLRMMKEGGAAQNRAIKDIWEQTKFKSQQTVSKGKGNEEDVKDTRQEATVLLYLTIDEGRFRGDLDRALISFYNQTFLFVWLGKVKKSKKMPKAELDELEASLDPSVEEILIQAETQTRSYSKLYGCMQNLDEKCREIIKWRFFDEPPKSWKEVASLLGYASEQAAQNKGGRCMRSLRTCMAA